MSNGQAGNSTKTIFQIIEASDRNFDVSQRYYYHIPLYQRGYRWTIDQAEKLINDIYINCKKYYDYDKKPNPIKIPLGSEYCLQPLVLRETEKTKCDGEKNYIEYNVIDGQQRLTTLAIIFCALNHLAAENDIKEEDHITISYERANHLVIDDFCQKVHNIIVAEKIAKEKMDKKKAEQVAIQITPKLKENLEKELAIDEQFVLNVYLYCYSFFKNVLTEDVGDDSYFAFTEFEINKEKYYTKSRLDNLRNLFKECTTVIWYVTQATQEEDVFEKFNAKKIELTKSELVKALFMNPDNYTCDNSAENMGEVIKTRQILIGTAWDRMEKELHEAELWHFFPHYDDWHSETHFDAVIDFFVYKKFLHKKGKKGEDEYSRFENPRYSFDMLEKYILADLEKQTDTRGKTAVMEKWWNELCEVYEWYKAIFEPDSHRSFKTYHRVALLQMMDRKYTKHFSRSSKYAVYFNSVKLGIELMEEMSGCRKSEVRAVLNKKITDRLDEMWKSSNTPVFTAEGNDQKIKVAVDKEKCDTLDKKIRALVYKPNTETDYIVTLLVIDSLHMLEQNNGANSRFSFYAFEKPVDKNGDNANWVREHIFAAGSDFNDYWKGPAKERNLLELLNKVINCGWEDYLKYRFEGILSAPEIEELLKMKTVYHDKINTLIAELENYVAGGSASLDEDKIRMVIKSSNFKYAADTIEPPREYESIYESLLSEFLKDNGMGNMSLLTQKDNFNGNIGNSPYTKKRKAVMELMEDGSFIPVTTVNVFGGNYCDPDFDMALWYPIHRQNYLKTLIGHIEKYLA